jgi:hypothetical protein
METLNGCDPRSSRRRRRLFAVLLVGLFAALAWAPGVVPTDTASAASLNCQSFTYCFQFRSAMSSTRAIDSIWWGSSSQQESVTSTNPGNGYWGLSFENSTNQADGVFQLRSVGQAGWCLTEPTSGNQLYVAPCVNTPGTDADNRQNWGLVGPSGSTSGQYALRSNSDGKCADVLNNSDYDGAWVGAWTCSAIYGSTNQKWTIADYSGTANAPGNSASRASVNRAVQGLLVKEYAAGLGRQIISRNKPGSITFCNWGGYSAWGSLDYARLTPGNGFQRAWSTPRMAVDQCSSIVVPGGQGVAAEITMHLDSGGGVTIATYFLTAGYTNTTFNFYGSTCTATTGVNANDAFSELTTTVVNAGIGTSCTHPNDSATAQKVADAASTVDANLAALNTQLGITGPTGY